MKYVDLAFHRADTSNTAENEPSANPCMSVPRTIKARKRLDG